MIHSENLSWNLRVEKQYNSMMKNLTYSQCKGRKNVSYHGKSLLNELYKTTWILLNYSMHMTLNHFASNIHTLNILKFTSKRIVWFRHNQYGPLPGDFCNPCTRFALLWKVGDDQSVKCVLFSSDISMQRWLPYGHMALNEQYGTYNFS